MKNISKQILLKRSIQKLCPQCGKTKIFTKWLNTIEECPHCHFNFEEKHGDTWIFTYMTTAGLTGIIILFMLLITPPNFVNRQIYILVIAFSTIMLTLPIRKALAFAILYWFEVKIEKKKE